jgi:replicative DNA helicase
MQQTVNVIYQIIVEISHNGKMVNVMPLFKTLQRNDLIDDPDKRFSSMSEVLRETVIRCINENFLAEPDVQRKAQDMFYLI